MDGIASCNLQACTVRWSEMSDRLLVIEQSYSAKRHLQGVQLVRSSSSESVRENAGHDLALSIRDLQKPTRG